MLQAVAHGIVSIPWDRLRNANPKARNAAMMLSLNAVHWMNKAKVLELRLQKMMAMLPLVADRQSYAAEVNDVLEQLQGWYVPALRPVGEEEWAAGVAGGSQFRKLAALWHQHFGSNNGGSPDTQPAQGIQS